MLCSEQLHWKRQPSLTGVNPTCLWLQCSFCSVLTNLPRRPWQAGIHSLQNQPPTFHVSPRGDLSRKEPSTSMPAYACGKEGNLNPKVTVLQLFRDESKRDLVEPSPIRQCFNFDFQFKSKLFQWINLQTSSNAWGYIPGKNHNLPDSYKVICNWKWASWLPLMQMDFWNIKLRPGKK